MFLHNVSQLIAILFLLVLMSGGSVYAGSSGYYDANGSEFDGLTSESFSGLCDLVKDRLEDITGKSVSIVNSYDIGCTYSWPGKSSFGVSFTYYCDNGNTASTFADIPIRCSCPDGSPPDEYGACEPCPDGMIENQYGACIPDTGCPLGMHEDPYFGCAFDNCETEAPLQSTPDDPSIPNDATNCAWGCVYGIHARDGNEILWRQNGVGCQSPPGPEKPQESADDKPDDDEDICVINPYYCQPKSDDEVCGEINGTEICVSRIPDGECIALPGGGTACDADAPAPPAPDNDTPGIPDQPDYVIYLQPSDNGLPLPTVVVVNGDNPVIPGGDLPGSVQYNIYVGSGSGGGGFGDFCDDNPKSIICRDGHIRVSCKPDGGVNFSCDWNPIQCEIAKQEAKIYCQDEYHAKSWEQYAQDHASDDKSINELLDSFYQEKDISGDMSDISFSREAFLSDGCPADRTVTLLGKPITFSFSGFCELADMLSALLIAIGYFIAGRVALRTAFG